METNNVNLNQNSGIIKSSVSAYIQSNDKAC